MSLKPLWQSAAELEVRGVVQREAADLLGIHKSSLERILKRDDVKAEIARLEEIGVVDTMSDVAVRRALLAVLPSGAADHKTRIAAAKMQSELPRVAFASEHAPISLHVHLDGDGQVIKAYEHLGPVLLHDDGTWERAAPEAKPPPKPAANLPGTPGYRPSSFSPN